MPTNRRSCGPEQKARRVHTELGFGWQRDQGKWMEVIADRASHKYTGRLEISFRIRVNGDLFVGTESVRAYDAAGNVAEAPPAPGQLEGQRVTIP